MVSTALEGGTYINGTDLARKFGIGRTTPGRWIRAGKLPTPERSIGGILLFERSTALGNETGGPLGAACVFAIQVIGYFRRLSSASAPRASRESVAGSGTTAHSTA